MVQLAPTKSTDTTVFVHQDGQAKGANKTLVFVQLIHVLTTPDVLTSSKTTSACVQVALTVNDVKQVHSDALVTRVRTVVPAVTTVLDSTVLVLLINILVLVVRMCWMLVMVVKTVPLVWSLAKTHIVCVHQDSQESVASVTFRTADQTHVHQPPLASTSPMVSTAVVRST